MPLVHCCDRCLTGRRKVKKYRLAITYEGGEVGDCTRSFVLCDEHLKYLVLSIARCIAPPVKRKKKD